MAKKTVNYIDGFTESVWKSLVIKSIRIGWVAGLKEAHNHLSNSKIESLLVAGLFEDVWPYDMKDLDDCYDAIRQQDYEWLCSRNTLHGRGYGQAFFDDRHIACEVGPKAGYGIAAKIKNETKISWLNPRIFNCLYTWYNTPKKDDDVFRPVCEHPWIGMPKGILDEHTYEGKMRGVKITLLSGHYENHLAIANRVMLEGWKPIQEEFANDTIVTGFSEQTKLKL